MSITVSTRGAVRRTPAGAPSRIRIARTNKGLSPEALGARVGVSGMTIRRVEAGGRPTVRTMFLIAKELGEEVTDLWPL